MTERPRAHHLRARPFIARVAVAMVISLGALTGCESPGAAGGGDIVGELPAYPSISAGYNKRLDDLARLQAPVSVVVESTKENGARTRDQLEGNLSVELPRNVALRLDKAGQNAAYLGSNDRMFWWMSLAEKERWVAVGTHLKATPNDAAEFGLPVHPLEFIELLGVLKLPGSAPTEGSGATVTKSKDRRSIVVTLPSRWGLRRLTLDPETYQPRRIELLTADGAPAATAELSRYVPVSIEGRPGSDVRVASNISVTVPQNDTKIILVVADPKGPLKLNPRAFDLVELVKAYNIAKLIDLTAPKSPADTGPQAKPATGGKKGP